MTVHKNSSRPNGHPGPNGRPNGHGPASAERGGVPALRDHAASDDASGVSVARAAAHPAAAGLHLQASTDREAYAEVAPPAPNETAQQQAAPRGRTSRKKKKEETEEKPRKELPRGEYPLPDNPAAFVQEIHRKIDLIEVWHSLLRNTDEKIKQRAVERLTAMLYDDDAIFGDESQQIVLDIDSAVARRAAEGARR
jgi:hypothetical protein